MKKFFAFIFAGVYILPLCINASYSPELQQAYERAYQYGITTQGTIEKANIQGKITREELSKMIRNYAINVFGKTMDTTKPCLFSDSNINPDLVQFVTESCQLGLMGQGITSFKPKDFVTRAEFGTVLSRILWGNKYEGGLTYYENHLKALRSVGIMNNISSPIERETRGYVMLMLMRSTKQDLDYVNLKSDDNQIFEVLGLLD